MKPIALVLGSLVAATSLLATAAHAQRPAPLAPTAAAPPTTTLTLVVGSCEGCELTLNSYVAGDLDVWTSDPGTVADHRVTFVVPTRRTQAMSIAVRAPWERRLGYVTQVVFRYRGAPVGAQVGFTQARMFTKGSGCWAGTTDDQVAMRLKVRQVKVDGVGRGQVPGSIAWASVTQDWLRPMLPTYGGVLGAQDVIPCLVP